MLKASGILAALMALSFIGCATNPYKDFYHSAVGNADTTTLPGFQPCETSPQIHSSGDFKKDGDELRRQGFAEIGYSSFNGAAKFITESNILEEAEALSACRILISSSYAGTITGAVPLVIPQNSTSYTTGSASAYGSNGSYAYARGNSTTNTYGSQVIAMPYSVSRYEAAAIYFAKRKGRLGVITSSVPSEVTQQIGKNGGRLVNIVVRGGPAYKADILEGDVLWSVNGTKVDDQNITQVISDYKDKSLLDIELYRGGKLIQKSIALAH
jgi:hypothetical protein